MFNLTEFDHVEKFTVYDAIEFLKNEKKMSLDIILLVLFCNVLNRRKDTIDINVYGQVHGGYRYKITDKNKKILNGEWLELESVYSWYNNPDNPNYCNINYEFEDEEIQTLKTYFFDKNELMQFLGFHSAKYNQDEQQKDKITAHQNKGITNNNNPDEIARLNAIIEQQAETIAQLEEKLSNPDATTEKENRTSQPQRDIFSLLVIKCYPDVPSRNRLFESINADMKEQGIRASDIKYPTLDNLIDENLRINNNSPFPQKNRK